MTVGSLVGALNNPHPYPSIILIYSVERHILQHWFCTYHLNIHIFPSTNSRSCPSSLSLVLGIFLFFCLIVRIVCGQLLPAVGAAVVLRQPRVDTRWMEFVLARENLYPEADAASKTEFID